jgi:hypothetical protein
MLVYILQPEMETTEDAASIERPLSDAVFPLHSLDVLVGFGGKGRGSSPGRVIHPIVLR